MPLRQTKFSVFILICVTSILNACGSQVDGFPTPANLSGDQTGINIPTLPDYGSGEPVITHQGSVGDGPIVGSSIEFKDAKQVTVGIATSSNMANYAILIPENVEYPITATSIGGIDLVTNQVPDFTQTSITFNSAQTTLNINPFSTLIYLSASAMPGGMTAANVSLATEYITTHLNFGLDLSQIPDPIATPINGSNAANIVKASETLGEMIRRTQSAMLASGSNFTHDQILEFLAADMTDGMLDGIGAKRTDARVSATANILSAQIIIEALSNNLLVNGSLATNAMDSSIAIIQGLTQYPAYTSYERPTSKMITQGMLAIEAALSISPTDTDLLMIRDSLSILTPDLFPSEINNIIPGDMSIALNNVVGLVSNGNLEMIDAVNSSINGTGTTNNTTPPVIAPVPSIKLPTIAVIASDYQEGNTPENIIDNDPGTRWASFGMPQWITVDLGAVYSVAEIRASFFKFDADRNYTYDIAASLDNINWERIIIGANSQPQQWSKNNVSPKNARYIQIILTSANNTDWAGLWEVEIYGNTNLTSNMPSGNNQPVAVSDSLTMFVNESINLDILNNDTGLNDGPVTVSILTLPENGTVSVQSDNSVTYSPDQDYIGTDSFIYQVTDKDGDASSTSVLTEVSCFDCASNIAIDLNWPANTDFVTSYLVFYGTTIESATTIASESLTNSATYNAGTDLKLNLGDNICFRIKARNSAGNSGYSEGICLQL